jgi:hypothetical protein
MAPRDSARRRHGFGAERSRTFSRAPPGSLSENRRRTMNVSSGLRYGRIAETYSAALNVLGFRRGVERFLDRLNLRFPAGARLLDAGCRTGLLSPSGSWTVFRTCACWLSTWTLACSPSPGAPPRVAGVMAASARSRRPASDGPRDQDLGRTSDSAGPGLVRRGLHRGGAGACSPPRDRPTAGVAAASRGAAPHPGRPRGRRGLGAGPPLSISPVPAEPAPRGGPRLRPGRDPHRPARLARVPGEPVAGGHPRPPAEGEGVSKSRAAPGSAGHPSGPGSAGSGA